MKVLYSDTRSDQNMAKIVWIFVGHLRFVLHLHSNLLLMNADIEMYLVRKVFTYLRTSDNSSKYGRMITNSKS